MITDSKVVWFRWHWEDVNGLVPTDECDWWEYKGALYKGEDALGRIQEWISKEENRQNMMTFANRKILWEIIDRPPQWYIDQMLRRAEVAVRDAQTNLKFWRSV